MNIYSSTKHSLNQYLSNYEGGYRHLNALRWLHKREPELWNDILSLTSFLPEDAKPKQRAYHILNDEYEIPKCPETGKELRWNDWHYNQFDNPSAKGKHHHKTGVFTWHGKEARAKAKQAINDGIENGTITYDRDFCRGERMAEAVKKGFQEKHGVDNIMELTEFRKKVGEAQPVKTPRHMWSDKKKYYAAVNYFTEKAWREHKDVISPDGKERSSDYALDHIYSRHMGFMNNIPPYIIGHHSNLQIIGRDENLVKSWRCDKSEDQLFEDFFSKPSTE